MNYYGKKTDKIENDEIIREKYKFAQRNRSKSQEKLILFLKNKLSKEDFDIAFDYIDDLEEKCNIVINLAKKL